MKFGSLISLCIILIFASCVKNNVTEITLNKSTSYLIIGQTDTLSATLSATGDIKNFPQTWSSSNSSVATVTNNGIVTAIGIGRATITDKAGDKTSACEVTVDDKILPELTQGELWYWGDAYSSKDSINVSGSNNFILYLASSGIKMDSLSGLGEILVIELNTSLSVKDSIPVGTYDMMTDLTKTSNFIPYTLVPAYVYSGYPFGCWYFGIITDPISIGNIVVTREKNIYSIKYEFFDDLGVKISGNFQGTISYVNGITLPAKISLKNRMKLKPVSRVNKTMTFERR